jgi:hypothetical protein
MVMVMIMRRRVRMTNHDALMIILAIIMHEDGAADITMIMIKLPIFLVTLLAKRENSDQ